MFLISFLTSFIVYLLDIDFSDVLTTFFAGIRLIIKIFQGILDMDEHYIFKRI